MAFLKGSKIEGNLYVEGDIRASQALSYTSTDNGDETITSLKDAKTGFDIMYVAYLVMAIVVAAVIVKASKRK